MKIRSRLLLVPIVELFIAIATYLALAGVFVYLKFSLHLSGPNPAVDDSLHRLEWMLLVIACAAYGIWRVAGYHPVFHSEYRAWLTTTPWTAKMPLPIGPISLAWQDALLLCPIALVAALHAKLNPAYIFVSFGTAYVATAAYALVLTRRDAAYWLALGLAGVAREIHAPLIALALMALLCVMAQISLERSLAKFPWEILIFSQKDICIPSPFDRLSPTPSRFRISVVQGILLGILAGTWTYATSWRIPQAEDPNGARVAFITALACVPLIRVVWYLSVGMPSVSLIGRVATGRLILPGYDKIFVAPAIAALLAVLVPEILIHCGIAGPSWKGISVGLVATVLFSMGPTLADWRLTGTSRIPAFRGTECIRV
jgi:hypothetical protein